MKALLRSLCLAALLLTGAALSSFAQEVSTGVVAGYQPKEGTMTITSDQTHSLITFFGVDKASIFTTDGKPMNLANLPLGSKVTVQYAVRGKQWYVEKVILPMEKPIGIPATVPQPQAGVQVNAEPSNSKAAMKARDGDITTNADVQKPKIDRLKIQR